MRFPYRCGDVRVPVDELADAESAKVVVVFGKRRSDHVRACRSDQLDEEAADTAGGPDNENGLALGGRERVEGGDRGDPRERRGSGVREVQAARLRRDEVVFRDGDQLRPAPVVHRGIGMEEEAEDLVSDSVAADAGADLLDDAGEVAAQGDGELVFGHLLQCTRRDEHVDGVDGGGVHAYEQLVVAGVGLWDVVSQGGLGADGLLHDIGPMGQRELGGTMGIDPSILVTMLNPLEERRFVTRRRDAADRRRHIVLLTDAGTRQLTQAARAQQEAEDVLFAGLDNDQREQLRQVLLALRESLEEREESP